MLTHSKWKHALNHYKNKQWALFAIYKIHSYWIAPHIFKVHGKNRTVANLVVVDFLLRENRRQVASFPYELKLESEISPLKKCFNVQMGTKKRLGKPYNMDEFQISSRNNSFHPLFIFPFTARKFWFCAHKISQNQLNISGSLYASFLFMVNRSIFIVSCCYLVCIILLF